MRLGRLSQVLVVDQSPPIVVPSRYLCCYARALRILCVATSRDGTLAETPARLGSRERVQDKQF